MKIAVWRLLLAGALLLWASTDGQVLAAQLETLGARPITGMRTIAALSPSSRLRKAAQPVGLIVVAFANGDGLSECTGWVISPALVLTARHCIEDEDAETGEVTRISPESVDFILNYLEVSEGDRIPLSTTPVEIGEGDLDYVLFTIASGEFDLSKIWVPRLGPEPAANEDLMIIQYPFGRPLSYARDGCKTTERDYVQGDNFRHICDTLSSSSGAPVFNQDFQVIGIHTAGGLSNDSNSYNQGVLIDKITQVSERIRISLQDYGKDIVAATVSTQTTTTMETYLLPASLKVLNRSGNWVMVGPDARTYPLRLQSSNGGMYVFWEPSGDSIYRFPVDGGVLEKLTAEGAWALEGEATKE